VLILRVCSVYGCTASGAESVTVFELFTARGAKAHTCYLSTAGRAEFIVCGHDIAAPRAGKFRNFSGFFAHYYLIGDNDRKAFGYGKAHEKIRANAGNVVVSYGITRSRVSNGKNQNANKGYCGKQGIDSQ
jgi:hypothetical protein